MFSYTAKRPGKVISRTDHGIIVEFDDGRQQGFNLGLVYGKQEGSVYPHEIVTPLKVGDTFDTHDPVVYNTGFFEPDILNPKQIVWKSFTTVKCVFYESAQTHEDSCSLSRRGSALLESQICKVKSFVVDFKQGIRNVVKVHQPVKPDTILLMIEEAITSNAGMFDDASLLALKRLANKAPEAKVNGIVSKIEVIYHGDITDMSVSLRQLTEYTDGVLAQVCKDTATPVITGRVNEEYRVSGKPLLLDTAEIRVYILVNDQASVGD